MKRRHTGKMTRSGLKALRQDLHAYDASAYPMGRNKVRDLLTGHFGMTGKGADRVLRTVLKR